MILQPRKHSNINASFYASVAAKHAPWEAEVEAVRLHN